MARHIAAIHVLKGKLGLSDDDYRALLVGLAQKLGLAASRPLRPETETSAMERKVWALWHQLHQVGLISNHSAPALNAYVYRQVGVSALRFATPAQLDTLIESLKSWAKRGQERLPQ